MLVFRGTNEKPGIAVLFSNCGLLETVLDYFLVPKGRLELPLPYENQILNLACLPIPPLRHVDLHNPSNHL